MFRLFLRKKLLSAMDKGKGSKAEPVEPPKRDRRVYARFNIDHKHLTLMNEQDILLVREISAKGFSTEVSPRGFDRLTVGDVYDARIRYFGEIYGVQARVAWKHETVVGFEMVKAGKESLLFLQRLLRPIEIACSLRAVETSFMAEGHIGKTWYHGDEESDLYTWHHPETNDLKAWQLSIGNTYIEWTENRGLSTGALLPDSPAKDATPGAALAAPRHSPDQVLDRHKRQLAVDVIMALQQEIRDDILVTLAG